MTHVERAFSDAISRLGELAEQNLNAVRDWAEKLTEDPFRAFEWQEQARLASAHHRVQVEAKEALELRMADRKGQALVEHLLAVRDFYRTRVLEQAKWPARSTSPGSNAAHEDLLAATADLAHLLDGFLHWLMEAVEKDRP